MEKWSSHWAHNPEIASSNLASATNKQTMKSILVLLFFPLSSMAQAFIGVAFGNHTSANAYAGYAYKEKAEISVGWIASAFNSSDKYPQISYAKAAYNIKGLSVGIGLSQFNYSDGEKVTGKSGSGGHALYYLEYGKTFHTGKIYIGSSYTGNLLYIQAGIKAYFK